MKRTYVQVVNRVIQYSGTFVMLALASYSIWYCHTALSPFSKMKKIVGLDQRVRLALFRSESIQRGFLLTQDSSSIPLYTEAKTNLRTQVYLLAEEISSNRRERDIAREIQTLVELKIGEMDSTINAGLRGDLQAAIGTVRTRIGLNYSTQICTDLDLIRGIETGRTYSK